MTKALTYLVVIWIGIATAYGIPRVLALGHEIQTQRREGIISECRDQNRRHDRTIAKLDSIAATLSKGKSAAVKASIRQSISYNVELIDALAPKQNCVKLADKYVSGG